MRETSYLRIFTAFAAALMLLLCGCGNSDGNPNENEVPEVADTSAIQARNEENEITDTQISTELTAITDKLSAAETDLLEGVEINITSVDSTSITLEMTNNAEKILIDKLADFFQSEECLNAEWDFGMYMSIGEDRAEYSVILWNEDELGNFRGTVFDLSGDSAKNIGTFAADISEEGKPSVAVGRLHGTKDLYFTPLIKTETGCRLVRYPFSADSIGKGEVIAEFEGDISENRHNAAGILADYWNRYIGSIPLRHDFERGEVVSDPYAAAGSADFKCDFLDYLYFHAGYLVLPETVRANGISVHMREEDVLAALGNPDSEADWGLTDDGYMKNFYYGDDRVDLFLDEPSGIWLVDSYVFSEFTTSIGINSGMTRKELLDSEIGGRLFVPYDSDNVDNDKTTVENAGALTTGDWKYGGLTFIFDGDIIAGISAGNGTSL